MGNAQLCCGCVVVRPAEPLPAVACLCAAPVSTVQLYTQVLKSDSCMQVAEKTIMHSGIFLQDARLLVTRHSTASLAVWHVATGALIAFFACDSLVTHLACTPQGVLAAGTDTGAVHFLQLPLRSGSRSFNSGPGEGGVLGACLSY